MSKLNPDNSFVQNLEILLNELGDPDFAEIIRRNADRIVDLAPGTSSVAARSPVTSAIKSWIAISAHRELEGGEPSASPLIHTQEAA